MHAEAKLLPDRSVAVRWAFAFGMIAAALFVVVAVQSLRDLVQPVDEWFWETAIRIEWQPAVDVADALRIIGSAWVMVPVYLAVGILLYTRHRWKALVFWAVAIGLVQALVWMSKTLYGRPRPPDSLVPTTGASFPSGHSATAALVAVGLVLLFAPLTKNRRYWFLGAAAWAVLMAASRVYLRAHWMTDVVAGATLGAAVALGVALVVDRWKGPNDDHANRPVEK